jgi:hypothetical protein
VFVIDQHDLLQLVLQDEDLANAARRRRCSGGLTVATVRCETTPCLAQTEMRENEGRNMAGTVTCWHPAIVGHVLSAQKPSIQAPEKPL